MFPLLQIDQVELPASILENARYPPFDDSITNCSSYDHVQIFIQLRQLLLARQSSMVSLGALRGLFNIVEHSILHKLQPDCIDVSDNSNTRSRALVLAAHVFMYVTLHQVVPQSPLLRRMCSKLQNTVGSTPYDTEVWKENRTALLWISFVGLLGTMRNADICSEGVWFLTIFQSIITQEYPEEASLGNGSIRKTLSTFLWDETYCHPLLGRIEQRLAQEANLELIS